MSPRGDSHRRAYALACRKNPSYERTSSDIRALALRRMIFRLADAVVALATDAQAPAQRVNYLHRPDRENLHAAEKKRYLRARYFRRPGGRRQAREIERRAGAGSAGG